MKEIIILSNIEYNFLFQRHQILANELLKRNCNVIFVESAAKRNPTFKDLKRILFRIIKFFKANLQSSDLTIISPLVLPSTFKFFRFLNKIIFIPILISKIEKSRKLHLIPNIIVYAPTRTNLDIIDFYNNSQIIYDCVSNFDAVPGMPQDTFEIETEIINSADNLVVDCKFLFEKVSTINSNSKINIIPPSVDYENFSRIQLRKIKSINKLLYYGYIDLKKIDIKLINKLAISGFEIHLVGLIDKEVKLHDSVKVYSLVEHDKLIDHILEVDALLLPYNINEYTDGIIPAKVFEYFASGLPVLSSRFYNIQQYKDLISFIDEDCNLEYFKSNKFVLDDSNKRLLRIQLAEERNHEYFGDEFFKLLS